MEQILLKGRRFKLWHYIVSHRQLLIRSPIDNEHTTNVDLWFEGVRYVELTDILGEIELVDPSTTDCSRLKQRIPDGLSDNVVTAIQTATQRYFVVSLAPRIVENRLDLFEMPYPSAT